MIQSKIIGSIRKIRTVITVVAAIILILSSAISEAKVPLRFPYQLSPGTTEDTAIAIMERKGFLLGIRNDDRKEFSWCSFLGDSHLARGIPITEATLTFYSNRLCNVFLKMPDVADENQQFQRLKFIGQFIRDTYFIDSIDSQIANITIGRISALILQFEVGRIGITITSNYQDFMGYQLMINFQDKWADKRVVDSIKKRYKNMKAK